MYFYFNTSTDPNGCFYLKMSNDSPLIEMLHCDIFLNAQVALIRFDALCGLNLVFCAYI